MWKGIMQSGAVGMLAGIALSQIVAVALSCRLRLGYFMPCPASLPEQVGGEINAVILQMAVCGLAGMGAGMAWRIGRLCPWRPAKRLAGAALSFLICSLPSVWLAACLLG